MQITRLIDTTPNRRRGKPSYMIVLDDRIHLRLKGCGELPEFPIRLTNPYKTKQWDNWRALVAACESMDIEHRPPSIDLPREMGLKTPNAINALTIVCPMWRYTEFMVHPDPETSALVRYFRGAATPDTMRKSV